MIIKSLGRVNVPVAGTPVPLTTNPAITASKLFVQAIPCLTGKTYLLAFAADDGESHARGRHPHPVAKHHQRPSGKFFPGNRRTARTASA